MSGHPLIAQRLLQDDEAFQQSLIDMRIASARERGQAMDVIDDDQQCAIQRLALRALERLEWIAPAEKIRIERTEGRYRVINRPGDARSNFRGGLAGRARKFRGVGKTIGL